VKPYAAFSTNPGEPPYTPVLYALSLFSPEFRDAVQKTWPAYMDGKRTLQEAGARQVAISRALPRPVPDKQIKHL